MLHIVLCLKVKLVIVSGFGGFSFQDFENALFSKRLSLVNKNKKDIKTFLPHKI